MSVVRVGGLPEDIAMLPSTTTTTTATTTTTTTTATTTGGGGGSSRLACLLIVMITVACKVCIGMEVYVSDECLDGCVVTSNYNPVCGTDYVTYTNPTSLLCWKKCKNPDLGVAHFSTCVDWITGNHNNWQNINIRVKWQGPDI
ncbi:hypothetical protein Pmani_013655 [Petrolisthes manimaculis]|uniref:Kazal-like domain-containing protein n=1 Tax=Petrolisthes manimaculis TaxID=1843537 RepID=A0AAE1U9E4_9EUCA|nr:hypothetical protein Pmani_013655 [Petrolisthes manimaculis]